MINLIRKYWLPAILFLIVSRCAYVSARVIWSARSINLLCCFLSAIFIVTGPGLFLLTKIDRNIRNLLFDIAFVIGSSLGSVMLVLWICYAFGIKFQIIVASVVIICAILAIIGGIHFKPACNMSYADSIGLILSMLFCEGIYEFVAGTPLIAWDAVISWDRWGADIASRSWIGGYLTGGYPLGIPLIQSVFYSLFVPLGHNPALSHAQLFMPGFFQVFPFLFLVSNLAVSKHLKISPFWTLAIILGNSGLLVFIIKHIGFADIPFVAMVSSALMLVTYLRTPSYAVAVPIIFSMVFAKGNGVPLLIMALVLYWKQCTAKMRKCAFAALAVAGTYFFHQWLYGVWTDLYEKSPFIQTHLVHMSHSYLIKADFNHLLEVFKMLSADYYFAPHTNIPILVLMIFLVGFAFFRRDTVRLAILTAAAFTVWFFHGSYDTRNMVYIYPLLCVVIPLSISRWRKVSLCLACLMFLCVFRTRATQMILMPFHKYNPPATLKMSPDELREKLTQIPHEEFLKIQNSPAKHILACSPFCRYFDNKGVWAFNPSRYKYLVPGDIAFSRKTAFSVFIPAAPFKFVSHLPPTWFRLGEDMYMVPFPEEKGPTGK